MSNSILNNRYEVFGRLGSFWASSMRGESLRRTRALIGLARCSGVVEQLVAGVRAMSGSPEVLTSSVTVRFNSSDVAVVGAELQQRVRALSPDSDAISFIRRPATGEYEFPNTGHGPQQLDLVGESVTLQTEAGDYWLFPVTSEAVEYTQEDWLPRYLIPIDGGLIPLKLRNSAGEEFINGTDFYAHPGTLEFTVHPGSLFEHGQIHVTSAVQKQENLFNYTLRTEPVYGSVDAVSRYVRYQQTTSNFAAAIAQVCGFVIAPWHEAVLNVTSYGVQTFYEFASGTLIVDYPHTALSIGDVVQIGDILGDPVAVYASAQAGDLNWWRVLDWSAGLSLDGLCPFRGITIPDRNVKAYAQGETDDVHVRMDFDFTDESQHDKFWQWIKANEKRTGVYLNSAVGLADTNATSILNPLNLWFDYLLGSRSWIIARYQYENWTGQRRKSFESFVTREKPFGCTVIIHDR